MEKKPAHVVNLRTGITRAIRSLFGKSQDRIFRRVRGVIHVGANSGQEIGLYSSHNLSVVWIEPIPEVYEKLKSNLSGVPRQLAIRALVTDQEDREYDFHIANNEGASSSILELNLHQDIWPEINFSRTIKLYSKTLPTLLRENGINLPEYDMLVMDTQGSELSILRGAVPILNNFTYIKTEVPDFESYKGCCQLSDLQQFFSKRGYTEYARKKFATHPDGGNYYDIIYKKGMTGK